MENCNWIIYLQQVFEDAHNKESRFVLEHEKYLEFREFICIPEVESFLLALILNTRNLQRGGTTNIILRKACRLFDEQKVREALDRLINSGWINCVSMDPFETEEKIFLSPMVEKAFRHSDSVHLPRFHSDLPLDHLKILSLKAASLRRGLLSLSEWRQCCMQFIQDHELETQMSRWKLTDEFEELRFVLLFISGIGIYENCNVSLDSVYWIFCADQLSRFFWIQKYMTSNSPLLEFQLVEIEKTHGIDHSIKVSDQWLSLLTKKSIRLGISLDSRILRKLEYKEIRPVELNYSTELAQELHSLNWLFSDDHLEAFKDKMNEINEAHGCCILLHGKPGTGKTEFVYQLARKTKRDVLFFDVSGARSKWYGETEKNIRKVFSEYQKYAECTDRLPILLFNEADNIFGMRGVSPTMIGQVENTIQTILLNELETFKGILIATSNIPRSFDSAFGRRFHFQIHLDDPNQETRILLLKNYFPMLTDVQCHEISEHFIFTGGDMQNLRRRKVLMEMKNDCRLDIYEFLRLELAKQHVLSGNPLRRIGYFSN